MGAYPSIVTRKQVLAWSRRIAQRVQTAMLDSLKETKDIDAIRLQKTGTKAKQTAPKKPNCRLQPSKNANTVVSTPYLNSVEPIGRCTWM